VYEESISAYEKDRLIREQEYQMKEQEFRDTLALVRGRLDQRQAVNYQLARDFFDYKHLVGKTRQRLQDEQDLAQVENQALKNQLDKLLDAVKHETKYSEKLFDQKSNNHAHRFRKLSKENEEDLAIVKIQYG
jgi:aspartate ammonia-lyase